jgi:aspartate aminotransferase
LIISLGEILVSSGGRPLIYATYRAICDKGDKVIYAVPSWNNNHYTHFVEGEHVVIEATAENNFMPTADDIRPHIKEGNTYFSMLTAKSNRHYIFQKRIRSDL